MNLARVGNKYLADAEPWKVVKSDPTRAAEILGTATQIMAALGVVFEPFLPFSAAKIRAMLGMGLADWSLLAGTRLVPAGQDPVRARPFV